MPKLEKNSLETRKLMNLISHTLLLLYVCKNNKTALHRLQFKKKKMPMHFAVLFSKMCWHFFLN